MSSTIFIDGWWLVHPGVGIATYASRIARLFASHELPGWRFELVTPDHIPCPAGTGFRPVSLRSPRTGHQLIDAALWRERLSQYVRMSPGVAVLFSPGPFWAFHPPRHTLVTYHDCIYRHFPLYLGRFVIRRWLIYQAEAYLRRCAGIVTESDFSRREIATFCGIEPERVAVIPAWLPAGYTPMAARAGVARVRTAYGLPDRYWLYVGGYDYRKNVEFLLEAYARASAGDSCPPLVLAGRIPGKPSPTTCDVACLLRQLGLNERRVIISGFVAECDLPGLYAGAELFVFPSLQEGFGLPPMEAMGCGCPALVADNSSLVEVVTDADYRFPTEAPDILARQLRQAATRRLPLNPGFDRAQFSEELAANRYRRWLLGILQAVKERHADRNRSLRGLLRPPDRHR